MSREKVINFLTKINAETPEYYFRGYTSPEDARRRALEAGIPTHQVENLYKAAVKFQETIANLEQVLREIREEFDILEEEVEY